jgi:hypothetical protein
MPLVRQALDAAQAEGVPVVVVGPHWTVCAQLRAALPASVFVGCAGPREDDFDRWLPPATWRLAPAIVYVSDDRFDDDDDLAQTFPERSVAAALRGQVRRGGMTVRRITVHRLDRAARGAR